MKNIFDLANDLIVDHYGYGDKRISVLKFDYKAIVEFLNQEEWDESKISFFDIFMVQELYYHGAFGVTTPDLNGKTSELTIVIDSSLPKAVFEYSLEHEFGHCVTTYDYDQETDKYIRRNFKDRDESESKADEYAVFSLNLKNDREFLNDIIEEYKTSMIDHRKKYWNQDVLKYKERLRFFISEGEKSCIEYYDDEFDKLVIEHSIKRLIAI